MKQQTDSNQPRVVEVQPAEREGVNWHSTSTLPDGTLIGRLGAYWYVLDEEGREISKGYHEITLDENGDRIGKRNARSEQVVLVTEPDQASSDRR